MNRESQAQATQKKAPATVQRHTAQAADPASVHPVRRQRTNKNRKKMHALQMIMLPVIALILITGLLLIIMPTFRVTEIVVEGNSTYTAEQIIAAAGIEVGDEMATVFFSKSEIIHKIFDAYPVQNAMISCGFSKVTITVTEIQNVMYTEGEGEWYSLDTNLRVLEKNAEQSAFSSFLRVKLPSVAATVKGAPIVFSNSEISYDYIGDLIETLAEYDVLSTVTYVDFSDKFSVSCVLGDRIRLELGGPSEMDRKMRLFFDILNTKGNESFAVIDVSNPSNGGTHQIISEAELYQ